MSSCTACGHRLGVGRFCANCGAPRDPSPAPSCGGGDWRTDTAERSLPRTPPSASAAPPPPRYPLYADELDGWSPAGDVVTEPAPEPAPEPERAPSWFDQAAEPVAVQDDWAPYDDSRRSPWLWIVATLAVLALVAAAWWFLVRDTGTTSAQDPAAGRPDDTAAAAGVDVAKDAQVEAPRTAPPGQDVDGAQVSFAASNMLDGVPETAWRVAGDATGTALRFTLAEPTELTQVGLVNGYAKTSTDDQGRTFDWYAGNRRVTEVVWVFPGGATVRQSLTDQREPQLIDIDPVTTKKVVLRIAAVSPPGEGTASRDFTAISEVSLIGTPSS